MVPPPPPPPGPQPDTYDFIRPFAYVFEDPRWVVKVLIGGLFFFAAFLLIGIFFLMGYFARLVRNVIAGVQYPLPEWDDLGEYFSEGLTLFCVSLVYTLPVVLLAVLVAVPAGFISAADNEGLKNLGGCVLGSVWCLIVPIGFAMMFFIPGALLMAITKRRFGAAFEFREIWAFIRANIGNYLLAIVVYLVARFLAGFGIILLCIGIVFTEFWAMCVTAYAFGEVYRKANRT